MRLSFSLICMFCMLLGACNSMFPTAYVPKTEQRREVDKTVPLAKLIQPTNMQVAQVDYQNYQNTTERHSMKKRLSLPSRIQQIEEQKTIGASGVYPLMDGVEAFAVRNALIKNAQHSLDLQYYSLHRGLSSRLLIRELVHAADRGVKIRILLDDMDTLGRDKEMTILAAHANIDVRIFNPIRYLRGSAVSRSLVLISNIKRLQRRMHNKVWLADGVLGITGGRNIGDRYFNANASDNFSDLDVLIAGAAVHDIQVSFDTYWDSANSIPVDFFEKAPDSDSAQDIQEMIFRTNALTRKERVARHPYLTALSTAEDHLLPKMLSELMWGTVNFYSDPPDKITTPPPHETIETPPVGAAMDSGSRVFDALLPEIAKAQHEVVVVNPYFLPGDAFIGLLGELVKKGVKVTVLTNSLESNDVPLVNGHYSYYRLALLRAGVHLYELRGFPHVEKAPQWRHPIFSWQGSRTALHTKAVVIDGQVSFVGSMNLDPRSVVWNTEVGVLIHQPEFAQTLLGGFRSAMLPQYSYEVLLDSKGALTWTSSVDIDKSETSNQILKVNSSALKVITQERGNFWRRLQKLIGASFPEKFL